MYIHTHINIMDECVLFVHLFLSLKILWIIIEYKDVLHKTKVISRTYLKSKSEKVVGKFFRYGCSLFLFR